MRSGTESTAHQPKANALDMHAQGTPLSVAPHRPKHTTTSTHLKTESPHLQYGCENCMRSVDQVRQYEVTVPAPLAHKGAAFLHGDAHPPRPAYGTCPRSAPFPACPACPSCHTCLTCLACPAYPIRRTYSDRGAALELSTSLAPRAFLPLACIANLAKNLAGVAASSTRAPIYRTFALNNNLADITAKARPASSQRLCLL